MSDSVVYEIVPLQEDTVRSLQAAFRRIIGRLDRLEAAAISASRQLIQRARDRVRAAVPSELTPVSLRPLTATVTGAFQTLAADFQALVRSFALEGAQLGEQFALAQAQAHGIDPSEISGAALSAGQVARLSDAIAQEASATISQVGAQLEASIARVFLAPDPTLAQLDEVLRSVFRVNRTDGSLSGAIAKVAQNLRQALGRLFSEANEAIQAAAAEADEDPNTELRKMWVHQGDARVRPDHRIAGRRYGRRGNPGPIPVKERFVVGGVRLRFPRDPAARGGAKAILRQIMGCRCDSVLVRVRRRKAS